MNINDIKEQKDYYPFGKEHENANLMSSTNRWGYNGKEKQIVGNLNYLDYINRMYDPEIGRWFVQDPLQEKYYSWSSYNYCMNNPIRFIDPDGREVVISGAQSDEALRQLQERMNNRITLTRDSESGRVSYTVTEGQKLKGDAKRMAGMIDNQSITVNIATTNRNETSTGNLMIGGAFMGNTVTTDADGNRTVVANQEVNPTVLGNEDAHTNIWVK